MNRLITRLPVMLLLIPAACPGIQAQDPVGDRPGQGGGRAMNEVHRRDMETIHALFATHEKISRQVTTIPDGVVTLTESTDPLVRKLIVAHAEAMKQRLTKGQPIRTWDPLFAALFESADKITMEIVPTPNGVEVTESSKDPWVVSLIRAHAAGVSEFVQEGAAIMHKPHPLPDKK